MRKLAGILLATAVAIIVILLYPSSSSRHQTRTNPASHLRIRSEGPVGRSEEVTQVANPFAQVQTNPEEMRGKSGQLLPEVYVCRNWSVLKREGSDKQWILEPKLAASLVSVAGGRSLFLKMAYEEQALCEALKSETLDSCAVLEQVFGKRSGDRCRTSGRLLFGLVVYHWARNLPPEKAIQAVKDRFGLTRAEHQLLLALLSKTPEECESLIGTRYGLHMYWSCKALTSNNKEFCSNLKDARSARWCNALLEARQRILAKAGDLKPSGSFFDDMAVLATNPSQADCRDYFVYEVEAGCKQFAKELE